MKPGPSRRYALCVAKKGPEPIPETTGAGGRGPHHCGAKGQGPHLWHVNWVRDLVIIGLVVFLVWFGYYLRGIFTPLLIALFLAYLFHPLITWCERRFSLPRPATIAGLIVLVLLVLLLLGLGLVPIIIDELTALVEKLPGQLTALSERVAEQFGLDISNLTNEIDASLVGFKVDFEADPAGKGAAIIKYVIAGTGHLAGLIESVAGAMLYVGLMAILIPFYFFYFAWKFGPLTQAFDGYIPASHKEQVAHIAGRMDGVVSAYFRERLIISGIMAVMFWIGWWICGVPYALLLGLAAGALSLIPYVGGVVWPLAILLAYLDRTTGTNPAGFSLWVVVIWPSVVFGVVQFIEGWILTPQIQGKSMEMNPVAILVVVFIGGAVGGLYGMILCIPIAACVKIVFQELVLPEIRRWAQTH